FPETVDWADKALDSTQVYSQAHAHAYAILAMAQWRLGRVDEARTALAKGDKLAPNIVAAHDPLDLGAGWVAGLFARIALDEATVLIDPASPTGENATKAVRDR
ncbi:MAG: tetratricopeptide repeat protein, partial [Verrucomicrobiota bacterium]